MEYSLFSPLKNCDENNDKMEERPINPHSREHPLPSVYLFQKSREVITDKS
jgi:hypothetical protein